MQVQGRKIPRIPFGRTGHESTRVIFGAAALGSMQQSKADSVLDTLLEFGVNHIDTAASYGDSEERIGPWMKLHRDRFFLASKTGDRTAREARESLHRSLDRLCTDRLDLIQLHNLVNDAEWETALGPGGALEALIEARRQGLVRFIGVTGHGTRVAAMHLRSLERFSFDSVLLPFNFMMLQLPEYMADVERLLKVCGERGVAVQTIKAVARRRWADAEEAGDTDSRHFSWYQPLRDEGALRRAVGFVLRIPGLFLNSSSDTTLLRTLLEAASTAPEPPSATEMQGDADRFGMRRLFEPGVREDVGW